ncbi:phosphoenolpyruvate carboxykinase (GTP) [Desulfopila sp. IMCC35006]|uniref:phosphoenolpyruvate carboxykinase (GTP) n=1 Tax=Desulfopila sp. IMCC35006 TaxID=2569542 RepID=UPI0010AD5430|nr:phosphoenolpyruvate carboxykinase (GTP) [Desulfopila sp. IMCC35006]TKB23569.1 phosphoenolpyruvate carboxykinase (GTP) [Desulfopila sp. IMCC35006]
MLELKKGDEILAVVGGIANIAGAQKVFSEYLDSDNSKKLALIKNEEALIKVANAIAMCRPDSVFVNTGSADDVQWIREYSLRQGEEKKLAKPGHTIHFDLPEDQARLVNQTFYIINEGEKMSSLAKTILRPDATEYVKKFMPGIMQGMTLIVGFYSRGPVGAEAAFPAIEISSSGYVLHSAEILYRNCFRDFDAEAQRTGLFFTNVHSQGTNTSADVPNARIFMDRSWMTTFATFCTYAGNTLLLKKGNHRFSVDYATYYKLEQQLSEHMFITGMTGPGGRKTFFAGAAPSGCGKTTTAMVGTDFIGDDLAQFWIDEAGVLRAINPEKGIFGIVEDVNHDGDPYLMQCLRGEGTEVIWSNVLITDGVPNWVGNGDAVPDKGINFQGEWFKGKTDKNGNPVPMSHKNSRCTLVASAIANHATELSEDPKGVPVKVITYSGRDADTMPPVWVAKNANEGVAIGASIVSKATATEVGATGVNRQPWANAPFIPGALADYMVAQFTFFNSNKFSKATRPIMAGLNYFLTYGNRGGEGNKLLGEKKDVRVWLGWLELFANGDVQAITTPIGYLPKYQDLVPLFKAINKEYPQSLYDMQFSLYVDKIVDRLELQKQAYSKEPDIPAILFEIYQNQTKELLELKEKFGPVIAMDNLI